MAGTGTIVHLATGALRGGMSRTVALGVGVLVGAQLGAKLSSRIHGTWILRLLALALVSLAVRLIVGFGS